MTRTIKAVTRNNNKIIFPGGLPAELICISNRSTRKHIKCSARLYNVITDSCEFPEKNLFVLFVYREVTCCIKYILYSKLDERWRTIVSGES